MTPEELASDARYTLAAQFTHAELVGFVVHWFFRRGSWLTRAHHAMSIATLTAIVLCCHSFLRCLRDLFLAFAILIVVVLPLHELLHALAYRAVGARDVRWEYSLRMGAVWVIAHRFVANARPFLIVALAPFVVINAILVAAAIAFPHSAVLLLFVVLWHIHGSIGDWSLMNFVWLHRGRGFVTFDDAEEGKSYFWLRVADERG